jgi:hypothetical protein
MAKTHNEQVAGVLASLTPEALDRLVELLAVRLEGKNRGFLLVAPSRQGANWLNGAVRSSKPVSRVLYSECVRSGDHLSSPDVTIRVKRPTRGQAGHPVVPLFGLAPGGVYSADWSPSRW